MPLVVISFSFPTPNNKGLGVYFENPAKNPNLYHILLRWFRLFVRIIETVIRVKVGLFSGT